jgi:hypothetical protein
MQPRAFFTGVKVRPIIVGAVVDYFATYLLIMLYIMVYYLKAPGLSEEAIDRALKEMLSSEEGLLTLIIIGAFCTALGGYIAARLAKVEEVRHGALVGAASLIIGVLQTAMAGEEIPVPRSYELLGYLLAIPAGALGGYFAQRPVRPSISVSGSEGPGGRT